MNASMIQSLIQLNADKIASKHAMLDHFVQAARSERFAGNESLMVGHFNTASGYRKQLAKLHAMQQVLHAELKAAYTADRIRVKVRKLNDMGYPAPAVANWASFQYESQLDALIERAEYVASQKSA